MPDIGFDLEKKFFFDRKIVMSAMDGASRRVLQKFGSFVWQTAKNSISKRKKPSAVGQPPSSHTGLLKKFIFFSYDPISRSVVIGPAKLNQKNNDIPRILEYGGTSTDVSGTRSHRKSRRVRIRARPFMGPALQAELPKLPAMWRASVK